MNEAGYAKAERAPASIDDNNPLTALEARIMNQANAASELAGRLESLADRLLGHEPETLDGRVRDDRLQRGYGDGGIGRAHDAATYLENQMSRVAIVAGRLSILGE